MMFPKEPSTLSSSECIEACLRCMVTCQDVAILFLEKGMKGSARLSLDCAEICDLCATLCAKNAECLPDICAICEDICAACAEQCRLHEKQAEPCKVCAIACVACAEECARACA